ncbi:MAG: hypothetical protein V4549_07370 [Bacteroidota bacterium]
MEPINKPRGTYADFLSGDYSEKHFVFELIKKNPQVGNNSQGNPAPGMRSKETGKTVEFPLAVPIPLVGTITAEKTERNQIVKYPRKIRYCVGENSIFIDEQQPDDKFPKQLVYANFVKGRFQVDGTDSTLLKFLFAWDQNETNEKRNPKKFPKFKLVDTSVIAQKAIAVNKQKFDVVKWCYTADWETEVKPLASVIFTHEHMSYSTDEIRHNLVVIAERDPGAFQKMLKDPKTERLMVLKAAIDKEIIVKNPAINGLFWSDNPNQPISVAASGKEVLADFIAKSFSSEGEKTYYAIRDLVFPKESEGFSAATGQKPMVFEAPVVKGPTDTTEELRTLIKDAVERGIVVISKNNVWWKFMDSSFQKEDGMIEGLRDNEIMLQVLKRKVLETPVAEVKE